MISGKLPIYCRNDTVGSGSHIQYRQWLAFFECLCLRVRFILLTIHTHTLRTQIGCQRATQTCCLQRRLGTLATHTCIVSKLSACICVCSGFCTNVSAPPSHRLPCSSSSSSSFLLSKVPPPSPRGPLQMEQQHFFGGKMGFILSALFCILSALQ